MSPTLIINYVTSLFITLVGIFLLVSGIFPSGLDLYSRIAFGIIFIAYGIYRFVTTQTKRKLQHQDEMREKMREEREKLFKNVNK